jgi:protein-L-isoaspartate O-methyltransferase
MMAGLVLAGPRYPAVTPQHRNLIKAIADKIPEFSDMKIQHAFECVPRHMFLPKSLQDEAYKVRKVV